MMRALAKSQAEVPPAQSIVCRSDGVHYAVCATCNEEFKVVTKDVQVYDHLGREHGFTTDYDLSAYDSHHRKEH